MTLITLPKWTALIVYAIFRPGASIVVCVWMLINGDYNWSAFAAGVWASIAMREMFKLKETFFND